MYSVEIIHNFFHNQILNFDHVKITIISHHHVTLKSWYFNIFLAQHSTFIWRSLRSIMSRIDFIGYLISTHSFMHMEHHFRSIKSWKRWSNTLFWLVFSWGLKIKSFKILRKLVKGVFYGLFLGQNFEWSTAFFRITHFPKSLNPGQNFERKFRIFNEKSQFCRKTRLFFGVVSHFCL